MSISAVKSLLRFGEIVWIVWGEEYRMPKDTEPEAFMASCDYIMPRHQHLPTLGETLVCLLKADHKGKHLVKRSDGIFMLWEPDRQNPAYWREEDYSDFIYEEISPAEAVKLLPKSVRP